jgi:YegS/Rv2252/BmrU family lipid kinase
MRTFTAVINPAAGGGARATFRAVAQRLDEAGATVSVLASRSATHAAEVAGLAARRGDVVVAVGGDGMTGCVAGSVVAERGVLGIVPTGRGNDFARALGLPGGPEALARCLLDGGERVVDVIEVGDRVVLGSVYAGIDSVANAHANRSRLPPSEAVYLIAALRTLVTWRAVSFRVTIDGRAVDFLGYAVVAANSGYYGGGLHVAPEARLDDGLLDVVLVAKLSRLRFAWAAVRDLPRGTHLRLPQVSVYRGRDVRIEADRALPAFGDGEPLTPVPVRLRVRPAALRVITP